ncbi:GntR family transcriptional regulator [Pseudoroseomonas rhizosphaerae]|uniref:GntR family transcriptional regulator n=1 Tax=Teichococcus rhizosphaerae TaxID=1335062 RepID=A0A2C7AA33_9PROT|nr:GntR family transcriptional regulator [Pseudoroseomonas rhizosphaerae]PHK94493.1 GntR family transcriptional regulator [Pseudoroseomonas rhizosphaerae]
MNHAIASLPLLERRTLSEAAYAHLRDLLASGRVAPGERLSLRDLSEALGVSVMPVREAVSRLIADRALEVAPNRAVRVPVMTRAQFRELAETRAGVEGLAAARAALRRTPAQLRAIEEAEAALRENSGTTDLGDAVALNRDFHFALYEAAGLPTLLDVIGGLWLKAGPVINLDLRHSRDRLTAGHALRCHAAALGAIRAQDAEAARAAIAEDIARAADFIIDKGGLPEG